MDYSIHLLTVIALYVGLTISLDLMIGHTGILSLAHAAFFGIGAYATAILTVYAGWNWFPAMIAAVVIAASISVLIAIPILRLGGDYVILALFGVQIIVITLILNLEPLTNGPFGIRGVPRPSFGGVLLESGIQTLVFTAALSAVVVAICWAFVSSPMRSVMHAIRHDETVALALGIDVVRVKVVVFSIASGLAALIGAAAAFYLRFVDVSSFKISTMILLWAMVFVGGTRTISGAIVGPIILVLFPEFFRFLGPHDWDLERVQEALYGLLLVVLMLYRPQGLMGKNE